jgi:hypothetical protein
MCLYRRCKLHKAIFALLLLSTCHGHREDMVQIHDPYKCGIYSGYLDLFPIHRRLSVPTGQSILGDSRRGRKLHGRRGCHSRMRYYQLRCGLRYYSHPSSISVGRKYSTSPTSRSTTDYFQLRMPVRQRLAVGILFGLGIIVTGAGIVRTWYIYRSLFNEYDQTWYAYPLWIAAAIEIDLGVVSHSISHPNHTLMWLQICASAPVLRPLLAKIPFSLSDTFSRGFTFGSPSNRVEKLSGPSSTPSAATPAQASKRRADDILAVPELNRDKGRSYELAPWDDVEQGTTLNDTTRGSSDGEEKGSARKSRGELWRKGSPSGSGAKDGRPRGLTITKTSEVELRSSRRFSRSPFSRKEYRTPPLPLEQRGFAQ